MNKINIPNIILTIIYNILVIALFIFFFNSINTTKEPLILEDSVVVMNTLSDTTYEDLIYNFVNRAFSNRNKGFLNGSVDNLYSYYNTNSLNGRYSLDYEFKRISYLLDWSIHRGLFFTNIKSNIQITSVQKKKDKSIVKLDEHLTFTYMYGDNKTSNSFHLTIPHILTLSEENYILSIDKDYYVDFLNDGLNDYSFNLTESKISYTSSINPNFSVNRNLKIDDSLKYEKFPFTDHTATVINFDSKGYPLITSSTLNIENMPYDLGWDNKNIEEDKK